MAVNERTSDAPPSSGRAERSIARDPEVATVGSKPTAKNLTPGDFPIGTVVADKYRIEATLGEGGMGVVVAATHLQLRERVALKFLRLDDGGQGDVRPRFRREAQICAKIRNEHIVRVIDVGTFRDAEYMVMEHLVGTDLRKAQRANDGPLSIERAIELTLQICDGLAEVHAAGIVHRDLKPSNIFLTKKNDGTELVKILDFGISKWTAPDDFAEEDLTKTGAILGSPKYMAPEQLFGSSSVDARADIWSIGAILYELVTGHVPFNEPSFARLCAELASGDPPEPPRSHAPDLPAELDAAIMLCLQPDLDERLPNVAVLAGELLAAVKDPNADAVRLRLEATLASGQANSSGSVPAMKSGQYTSLSMAKSGSNPSIRIVLDSMTPEAMFATGPAPEPARASRGWMIAALLLLPAFAFAAWRASSKTAPPPPPKVVAVASAAPSVTTMSVVAAAPPTASASTVAAPVSASASAKKTTKLIKPLELTPPPTASVATTAEPTVKKKHNPLEERQ